MKWYILQGGTPEQQSRLASNYRRTGAPIRRTTDGNVFVGVGHKHVKLAMYPDPDFGIKLIPVEDEAVGVRVIAQASNIQGLVNVPMSFTCIEHKATFPTEDGLIAHYMDVEHGTPMQQDEKQEAMPMEPTPIKRTTRKFSKQERAALLAEYRVGDEGIDKFARRHGIADSTFGTWVTKANIVRERNARVSTQTVAHVQQAPETLPPVASLPDLIATLPSEAAFAQKLAEGVLTLVAQKNAEIKQLKDDKELFRTQLDTTRRELKLFEEENGRITVRFRELERQTTDLKQEVSTLKARVVQTNSHSIEGVRKILS